MITTIVLFLIIWFLFCSVAGKIAKGNGRSFWGFFLLSFLLTPLIGIIVALIMGESTAHVIERIKEEERIRAEYKAKNNQ